jgi:acetyl-CoA C-acetyltransferase
MSNKVYIANAALTQINRHYDKSLIDLAVNVVKKLEEGLTTNINPDIVVIANGYAEKTTNHTAIASKIALSLGINAPAIRVENADASSGLATLTAFSLIKSGIANEVLLIGVEKMSDFPSKYMNDILSSNLTDYEYHAGITPHAIPALLMKLYMKKYNKDYEYFTSWPILMHSYGSENPYSYLKFPVDKKTIMESQIISEPLRLFDVGARADGAAALLLVSEGRKNISEAQVELKKVVGSNFDIDWYNVSFPSIKYINNTLKEDLKKIDILEIHDSYSINAALIIENLRLSREGESFNQLDSIIPINYSGGLKSRGYAGGATGIYQIGEIYLQMLHKFPGRKVDKAQLGAALITDDLGKTSYLALIGVV